MTDLTLQTTLTADAGPLNAALKSGGQGVQQFAADARQASAAQAAAAKASADALAAQQRAMQAARGEAGQLRQAYRQLPMQITDVTTSLASGMPVWMVAIQQGGQIRDSFGGIKPAMEGVLSLLTPMRIGMMGLAGAAGVAALAYKQGAAEAHAYRLAIVMSGNAAGVTMGQLDGMARSVSASVGSQAGAAAALAQAVGTGRIAAANLEMVASTAIRANQATGKAVGETIDEFAQLAREPVAAAKKLNDQYNFLTVAVYEQIKALEKRGEVERAADLAQRTLANAHNARSAELLGNLSLIESAWLKIKNGAAEAWSSMLGRPQSLQQQLVEAEKALAAPQRRGGNELQNEERRKAMRQRVEDLRQQIYAEGEVAAAQQASAEATQKHLATEKDRDAAAKASAEAYKQLKDDIRERLALANAELANGAALSEAQRLDLDLKAKITEASGKLGAAKAAELRADAAAAVAAVRKVEAQQAALTMSEKAREAALQAGVAAQREADAAEKSNEQLRREVEAIGLEGYALLQLEQARVNDTIATKEQQLARYEGLQVYTMEEDALRREIEALKERRQLLAQREIKRADVEINRASDVQRRKEEEENERRSESIARSIGQGIMRGGNVGRNMMDVFRRQLEDDFERTVLRPLIQPITGDMMAGLGKFLGMSGNPFDLSGKAFDGIWNTLSSVFLHGGGTVGVDRPADTRTLPASLWANAPRYHKGMLAADEVPAVLQKGESVLTPAQLEAVAGAGAAAPVLNLTVVNASGTPVQATARTKPDGGIEVLLSAMKDSIAGDIADGTGPVTASLRQRFGLRDSLAGA